MKKVRELLHGIIHDGDYLVISEKAISTALGNLFDEDLIPVSSLDKVITLLYQRVFCGLFLVKILKLRREFVELLLHYPITDGSKHKKFVLISYGVRHFLKPIGEAGVDATNVPYKLVSLPLSPDTATRVAKLISGTILSELGVRVKVLIVDSDRLYVHKCNPRIILATRSTCIPWAKNLGFFGYFLGRFFRYVFSEYPTIVGSSVPVTLENVAELLEVARIAERVRGFGLGRTVLDVSRRVGKEFHEVTWSDLLRFRHCPIVVIRKKSLT